jgi:uncharacterized protein YprB with RNaseH-like and TPR domain
MNVDPQDYLNLVERSKELVFFDIESSGGFNADFGSTLCVSFKPFGGKPFTYSIKQVGNDQKIVREAKEVLESYQCWVGYYSKGFDIPYLNTRLLKWGMQPIDARHHLDMYFMLKPKTKMSRKGLGAYADFLQVETPKINVPQHVWSEMPFKMDKHLKPMIERCEGDCTTLEEIYIKTRHLVREIKRG